MQLREWLGLKPTKAGFAREILALLDKAGESGWTFDSTNDALRHGTAGHVQLTNLYLEYASARRADKAALLQKYLGLAQARLHEVPKLWAIARKGVYAMLRSRSESNLLAFQRSGSSDGELLLAARPYAGELELRIGYDFGTLITHISETVLATWGQTFDSVLEVGLRNLRALPRPFWRELPGGVHELICTATYAESFMLDEGIFEDLPFKEFAVCAPCNRNTLLCADRRSDANVLSLVKESSRRFRDDPWPLTAEFFARSGANWKVFQPDGEAGKLANDLHIHERALSYGEQKAAMDALHERQGKDVFVASFQVIRKTGEDTISSYCVWSKGVETLLPKTDLVALNAEGNGGSDIVLLRWSDLEAACGHRLRCTEDWPPRYLVDGFPDEREWEAVQAAAL